MAKLKRRRSLSNLRLKDEPNKYISTKQALGLGLPVNQAEREKALANMLNLDSSQVLTKDNVSYYSDDPGSNVYYRAVPPLSLPSLQRPNFFDQIGDLATTGAYYLPDIVEMGIDAYGGGLLAKKAFPGLAKSRRNLLNRFALPALGFGGISGGVNLAR